MLEPQRRELDLIGSFARSDESQDGIGGVTCTWLVGDGVDDRSALAQVAGDPACAGGSSGCHHRGFSVGDRGPAGPRFGVCSRRNWYRDGSKAEK